MSHVLVVGSGGREYAIVEQLCKDPTVTQITCSPGSLAMTKIDERVGLFAQDTILQLHGYAKYNGVDVTIVGPEIPLVDGIVDAFQADNMKIVGPTRAAAQLEGSKSFCKEVLHANGIPTADFGIFHLASAAKEYVRSHGVPVVIKADGLAAGKGVTVAFTMEEADQAIDDCLLLDKFDLGNNRKVVIEDYLQGVECSVMALTDGTFVHPWIAARDHKQVFDGNKGPNTGGMGAYAPIPDMTPSLMETIRSTILVPIVLAMARRGTPYRGILYVGLMLTKTGPKVLECNCRFGDPELQALMALLKPRLLTLLEATTQDGKLESLVRSLESNFWENERAVCLVLCSHGYPGKIDRGLLIEGLAEAKHHDVAVIHAGTRLDPHTNQYFTNGGRVLNIVATGIDYGAARAKAYAAAKCITFGGKTPQYRTDIAAGI